MKKFCTGMFVLLILAASVSFATLQQPTQGQSLAKDVAPIELAASSMDCNEEAQRGCCSWHGGVSHCGSSGYYICNDGSQSPSCRCN